LWLLRHCVGGRESAERLSEASVTASRRFAALAIHSFRSSPEAELVA